MTSFTSASMDRDANRQPIFSPLPFLAKKRMTFDGATTNDPGDFDGTGNPATLFNITGDVLVSVNGIVKTSLVSGGAATVEIQAESGDTILNPRAYGALATGSGVWTLIYGLEVAEGTNTAAAALFESVGTTVGPLSDSILIIGTLIKQQISAADITEGVIDYYCFWRPLSEDGNVVAA